MDYHALTEAPFATDADVRAVLDAVADGTLPRSAWNHRAHLTVALSIGRAVPASEALDTARATILGFNAKAGIESTPDSGYHETITAFYMQVVALHVARNPAPPSLRDDSNSFFEQWGRRDLPMQHYSNTLLFSRQARASHVPPDLQPLPTA